MNNEHFYDHFHRDRPTRPGAALSRRFSARIFRFAGMKAGSKVLEIGPGHGAFADCCMSREVAYTAIEPNPHLAEALEGRGIRVVRAGVPPMPALETKFDFIVLVNLLEHMNGTKEALEIVQQIGEYLEPQGALVVCSPDYLNMGRHFFNCDFSHGYVTTRRRLVQLLDSAGYDRTRSCYLSGPVSGFLGILLAGIAARLPFGLLQAWFPDNRALAKLYKLQLSLSRKVLVVARHSA